MANLAECLGCFDTGECLTCWGIEQNEPCERCGGSGDCPDCKGKNRVVIEDDEGENDAE